MRGELVSEKIRVEKDVWVARKGIYTFFLGLRIQERGSLTYEWNK